jgi:uncharacterized protein affecting Mg2+/Co2+ transport
MRTIQPTGTTRSVTVLVSCNDTSITVSVSPWARHMSFGDDISWTLAAASNTQDVTIDKVGREWAFHDGPPVHATRNNPGRAGRMKGSVHHGDKYQYSVEADCQTAAGTKIHGKIDPDMIVD